MRGTQVLGHESGLNTTWNKWETEAQEWKEEEEDAALEGRRMQSSSVVDSPGMEKADDGEELRETGDTLRPRMKRTGGPKEEREWRQGYTTGSARGED